MAALRDNQNKPETDYILTYVGGIDLIFSEDFIHYETVASYARWYRSPLVSLHSTIRQFAAECAEYGFDVVEDLVFTNTHAARVREDGTRKYPQGNYLKGANWRQYAQSFVRHMHALQMGFTHDKEGFPHRGNAAFNLLMSHHCQEFELGVDDRIRP